MASPAFQKVGDALFYEVKIMNIYNVGLTQQGQILLGIVLSIGFVSSPLLVVMLLMWWEKQLEKLS